MLHTCFWWVQQCIYFFEFPSGVHARFVFLEQSGLFILGASLQDYGNMWAILQCPMWLGVWEFCSRCYRRHVIIYLACVWWHDSEARPDVRMHRESHVQADTEAVGQRRQGEHKSEDVEDDQQVWRRHRPQYKQRHRSVVAAVPSIETLWNKFQSKEYEAVLHSAVSEWRHK